MDGYTFSLCRARLTALPSGALWWAEASLLCVGDLHLGKSERVARRGGPLLPPYESEETLVRLARDIRAFGPRTVISLGDSFDDCAAGAALPMAVRDALVACMSGRRWIWVEGNHDPGPVLAAGTHVPSIDRGPLTFRHITARTQSGGEVSAHFHPKISINAGGRRITRPCFVLSGNRLILPAYGAYTGGLPVDDPAFTRFTETGGLAILTGRKVCALPLRAAVTSA